MLSFVELSRINCQMLFEGLVNKINNAIRFLMVNAEASDFVLNGRTTPYVECHIIFKSTGVSLRMTL